VTERANPKVVAIIDPGLLTHVEKQKKMRTAGYRRPAARN
jgi:hypothetical protein